MKKIKHSFKESGTPVISLKNRICAIFVKPWPTRDKRKRDSMGVEILHKWPHNNVWSGSTTVLTVDEADMLIKALIKAKQSLGGKR